MTSRRAPRPKGETLTPPSAPASAGDLERLLEERGRAAIETVRKHDPGAYLRFIARLVDDED